MNSDSNKKDFLKNVLFTFIAFAIYKTMGTFVISHIKNSVVNVFVTEVTILTCAVCLALIVKKIDTLKPAKKGFGTGLLVGLFLIVMDMIGLGDWINQYAKGQQAITISSGEFILFILAMVMVGIAEELMFRGVLLNSCLEFFGENSISSIRKSIIISGCIFGAFHVFNVLVGASLYGSVIQAISAAVLGIVFGAIYVRCGKNIWPCIVIHGVHDAISFMQSGMLTGKGLKDAVSGYDARMLFTVVISLLVGLFLMRKKKMSQCVK